MHLYLANKGLLFRVDFLKNKLSEGGSIFHRKKKIIINYVEVSSILQKKDVL